MGAGGALVKAGDTLLTPEGAYVRAGGSYLKPGGGAVVKAGSSYVGTDSALVNVGSGPNLILIGSDGASIGAGNTILRPHSSSALAYPPHRLPIPNPVLKTSDKLLSA